MSTLGTVIGITICALILVGIILYGFYKNKKDMENGITENDASADKVNSLFFDNLYKNKPNHLSRLP